MIRPPCILVILLALALPVAGQTTHKEKAVQRKTSIVMPRMSGGPKALDSFVKSNLRYPDDARESETEGRSVVRFLVNEQGEVSRIETARSSGNQSLDGEARRIVSIMPKWIPGREGGRRTNVYYLLPVIFQLD